MKEKMNCNVIRDLIPLCAEGLCSEESKALIEAHVETCADCKKLYEKLPAEPEQESPVPTEGRAFQKVNRKLKTGKAWLILLVAVLLGLLYLTIGQIAKVSDVPQLQSFETLWRTAEVYPIARMLADGDFERFEEWVSAGELNDLYIYKHIDEIRAQDVENLKATYQAAYGNSEVKRIEVVSYYTGMYAERSKVVGTEVELHYSDGRNMVISMGKDIDGLYIAEVGVHNGSEQEENFRKALDFASNHEVEPRGFTEIMLTMEEMPPELDNRLRMIANRFSPEYRESLQAGIAAYLNQGYQTTACTLTPPRFEAERHSFYYEFTLTGKDDKGTALMAGRMYLDYRGIYPPAAEDVVVYENGCTPELTDALLHFFG